MSGQATFDEEPAAAECHHGAMRCQPCLPALIAALAVAAGCEEASRLADDAASAEDAAGAGMDGPAAPADLSAPTDGPGALACGEIRTFAHGRAPTREVHVAVGGSDANGDGSAGRPFATIGRAVRAATPGTAVRIHAGTYPGGTFLGPLAGSAEAPIWIGGAPGEARPVLEGGTEGLHLSKVRYLVVEHLEVRGASGNGINCDDGGETGNAEASRFVELRDLAIHDIGGSGNQDCLKLSGLRDFFVLDSEFSRCGGAQSGSGVDDVGCHRGLIARNRFRQLSANAVQAKGGTSAIEIRANLLVDAGSRGINAGGSTGFAFFRPPLSMSGENAEASDIRVIANVIVGSEAAVAFVGCVDCVVANNTIVDPTRWVARILQETTTSGGYTFTPARRGRFENNLVYFRRAALSTFVNVGPNTDAPSFVFANNLWYAHDDPARSAPQQLPVAETGAVVGQDPRLVDPAADHHLQPQSPAIGRGAVVPGVDADHYGRCYRSPPSIGAAEGAP